MGGSLVTYEPGLYIRRGGALVPAATIPGPVGPAGPAGGGQPAITLTAGEAISVAEVVYVASDGQAWKSSSSDADKIWRTIGVASSNALTGEVVEVIQDGLLTIGTPFTPGPLFLDVDGSLTSSPSTGIAQVHVADALETTTLAVRVDPAIYY